MSFFRVLGVYTLFLMIQGVWTKWSKWFLAEMYKAVVLRDNRDVKSRFEIPGWKEIENIYRPEGDPSVSSVPPVTAKMPSSLPYPSRVCVSQLEQDPSYFC